MKIGTVLLFIQYLKHDPEHEEPSSSGTGGEASFVIQILVREVRSLVPQELVGRARSLVPQEPVGKARNLVPKELVGEVRSLYF